MRCRYCWSETARHELGCPVLASDPQNAKAEWVRGYLDGLRSVEKDDGGEYYRTGRDRGAWARDERDE